MNWKSTNRYMKSGLQPSAASGSPIEVPLGGAPLAQTRVPPASAGRFFRTAWNVMRPYGLAVSLVAAAFGLTFELDRVIRYPFPFLFFAAVMASAWFGGQAAGLFSVVLSTALVDYYLIPPADSFVISNADDAVYFGAFVTCALTSHWVSLVIKRSELALREARDQLEARVAERTAELRNSNAELRRYIEEHDKAQQALMKTQAQLAHLSRVFSMGELTASIAHEINQPLAAVVTHGHACLEWLSADPPNLTKLRQTAESIVRDGTRAGTIIGRIRSLFRKEPPARSWVDVNEVIAELSLFLRDEAIRRGITIRTQLATGLPRIMGDSVQLQQVVLNLLLNGMDAMAGAKETEKELRVSSRKTDDELIVGVEDSGVGLPSEIEGKIFEPFFTTKPQGVGMGLSISRSIIESHHGRLWAERRAAGGTVFQFAIPLHAKDSDD